MFSLSLSLQLIELLQSDLERHLCASASPSGGLVGAADATALVGHGTAGAAGSGPGSSGSGSSGAHGTAAAGATAAALGPRPACHTAGVPDALEDLRNCYNAAISACGQARAQREALTLFEHVSRDHPFLVRPGRVCVGGGGAPFPKPGQ